MNKIFIVTGANRGLGEALVMLINKTFPARVISISRSIADAQKLYGENFYFIKQDFLNEIDFGKLDSLQGIFDNAEEIVFINNAGVIEPIGKLPEVMEKQIEESIRINITAPLLLIRYFISAFPSKSIHFVNITSGASKKSIANWSLYSSSKAYMYRFFEILKEENKDNTKFRFTSIDPGVIDTGMQDRIRSSDFPMKNDFVNIWKESRLQTPEAAARRVLNEITESQ